MRQGIINEMVSQNDYLHAVVHSNPGSLKLDSRIVRDQLERIRGQGFIEILGGKITLQEAREALKTFRS